MSKIYQKSNKGFTLMEIMVVIIVIAVLASVAGPMIGTITDQGRASATRAQMSNIKSALINYKSDVGHYPHSGNIANNVSTNAANDSQLGIDVSNNVLVNNLVANYGLSTYATRWKGPYMDSDPSAFMADGWSTKIHWVYENKQLWLRSYGPDAILDSVPCANVAKDTYTGDDIVLSIAKVTF